MVLYICNINGYTRPLSIVIPKYRHQFTLFKLQGHRLWAIGYSFGSAVLKTVSENHPSLSDFKALVRTLDAALISLIPPPNIAGI